MPSRSGYAPSTRSPLHACSISPLIDVWIDCSRTAGLPRPVMPPQAGTAQPGLLRSEPQGAIQADVLAVEVGVADDRLDHQGELLGIPHPLGEHDPLRRILLEVREIG